MCARHDDVVFFYPLLNFTAQWTWTLCELPLSVWLSASTHTNLSKPLELDSDREAIRAPAVLFFFLVAAGAGLPACRLSPVAAGTGVMPLLAFCLTRTRPAPTYTACACCIL